MEVILENNTRFSKLQRLEKISLEANTFEEERILARMHKLFREGGRISMRDMSGQERLKAEFQPTKDHPHD